MKREAFFFNGGWSIALAMCRLFLLLLLLMSGSVSAAETAWQELAPGVRIRLVSSDVLRPDGTTLIGLQLDMPANTKTYWRIPGETGIAPEFDFTGSSGLRKATPLWPFPTVDHVQGYLDYVYFGRAVLPFLVEIEPGNEPQVDLRTTLGICSDICIPAMSTFSLALDFAEADAAQSLRLSQAEALVPVAWDGPAEPIAGVSFDPAREGLTIALADPAIDPDSVIADTGNPTILFGTPQKSPDGRSVFLPLLDGAGAGLGGQSVRITFMTAEGPYEVTQQVRTNAAKQAD